MPEARSAAESGWSMKVVINKCWGGFGLSKTAVARLLELGYPPNEFGYYNNEVQRNDLRLIQVVEELGSAANGECSRLRIIDIPDGTVFEIDDYDGQESVHEIHQSWG